MSEPTPSPSYSLKHYPKEFEVKKSSSRRFGIVFKKSKNVCLTIKLYGVGPVDNRPSYCLLLCAIGEIRPYMKIAITLERVMPFGRPLKFIISTKIVIQSIL